VGECFFRYRLTRVVPHYGPQNGCSSCSNSSSCCLFCHILGAYLPKCCEFSLIGKILLLV